jgi:hypothetical protein
MPAHWCKRCKLVFHEDQCPEAHANFMYTSKIPTAVAGAGLPPPPVAATAVAAPRVHRLRAASEEERLQAQAALAEASAHSAEEEALDAELAQVQEETQWHWEVNTGGGLWGKAGGGFVARETGQARAEVAETQHDFYQPLTRTMMVGGKTKDTWVFNLWPPHSDDSLGQTVVGRVVVIHGHHVVRQGKAKGYLRSHKTAEQAREYLAIVLDVTECESRPALGKMLGAPCAEFGAPLVQNDKIQNSSKQGAKPNESIRHCPDAAVQNRAF